MLLLFEIASADVFFFLFIVQNAATGNASELCWLWRNQTL